MQSLPLRLMLKKHHHHDDDDGGSGGEPTTEIVVHTDDVIENEGEGYDVVNAVISYALADNVEELNLLGNSGTLAMPRRRDQRHRG